MISFEYKFIYKGNESLKRFVNKEVYEKFLLFLLKQINEYKNLISIENQSNSEDDFMDLQCNQSYETTLLINNSILSKVINNEEYLFSEKLYNQRMNDTISCFIDTLERKAHKRGNLILFNIFPDLCPKFQKSNIDIIFRDKIDEIIKKILKNRKELLQDRICLVSFNIDNSFYYRQLYPQKLGLCFIKEYNYEIFPFICESIRLSK